jgi:hypothetical protein
VLCDERCERCLFVLGLVGAVSGVGRSVHAVVSDLMLNCCMCLASYGFA